ncbi:MAG: alpha/beta hydrolase [Thermoleophilia bacterium]|nr:alpha/beta hydrolase [Thermoleophilia bacterium]
MRRIVLAVSTLVAMVGLALVPVSSSATAHACTNTNELWFRAGDGTTLVGHRFGGKKPGARTTVVFAHMSVGDLCQWVPFARNLAAKGYFAFPFDLRGHGFSKGSENHRRSPADVVAAVRAVRALGAKKIIVVGASLGGIAAVMAAPKIQPPVTGVVAVSAPAAIAGELDALSAAGRLRVPTLYVAAEDDQNPPYDFAADAKTLFDATGTLEKRLEVVPGALHGTFLVMGSKPVRSHLLEFLRNPAAAVP